MLLLASLLWCGGFYFSDATVYDPSIHSLREGVHILVDASGKTELVVHQAPQVPEDYKTVDGALVLPHYADFYSLVQDRGLGFDENISRESQERMARHFRALGMYTVRDPVFPPAGLSEKFEDASHILAQNGYLEMKSGPAAEFALIVGPDSNFATLNLPQSGPLTLWWSDVGTGTELQWPKHPELVKRLIGWARERGQKIGCYIQDAKPADMQALYGFDFDFYEGIPGAGARVSDFPDSIVWAPLASLNDKRYCALYLDRNMAMSGKLGLYGALDLSSVERNFDVIRSKLGERCGVWKRRRKNVTASLREWLESDGKVAIGSAGGHMFAFSGDIRTELEVLEEAGATQKQLLEAAFETTPALLGDTTPYLKTGRPAHFIVYVRNGYWLSRLGERVDYNFVNGKEVR